MQDLAGKVGVITGASRGLGAGLAQNFRARGLKLGLCARSAIEEHPGSVTAALDVRDASDVEAFCQRVTTELGAIDLWINNAGVLEPMQQVRDVSAEDFSRHLEINVVGVLNGTRSYIGHLRSQQSSGVLINISSGAGRHPYSGWGAYCAGKAAVDRLTEVVAVEERDAGLRAYAVAPGVIDTGMQELIRSADQKDFPAVEVFRQMKEQNSFSTTDEVANGLLALAFERVDIDDVLVDLRDLGLA